jgi:hypothetical protein
VDTSEEQIRRESTRLKWLYPGTAFSAGTWMTYFSTYLSMLYTDVYMLPGVCHASMLKNVRPRLDKRRLYPFTYPTIVK